MTERYRRNPNTNCIVCNKLIYRRPREIRRNKGRVFCSLTCYGLACLKEHPCIVCGKPVRSGLNKKTCSRSCANKNRSGIKYTGKRLKDAVVSLRLLKIRLLKKRGKNCPRCGYDKYEILQIHHKDRDRNNNNLNNLELICPNCHSEEHYSNNSWTKKHY